ncbi:MAG: ATP-binding protein [Defluviitaleaceae bacterium]|nr:ATP-binding protein [Defluviitaleaceae bacterium]
MTRSEKNQIKSKNRLGTRARFMYMAVPAVAIVVLLIIGNIVSSNIADDFARRLARQYSIEAASSFQIATSPHFILMQQISDSTTISRWLSASDDAYQHDKLLAFEEIMGFARGIEYIHLMFTSYRTMQAYNIYADMAFDEFLPWVTVGTGEAGQWFHDTRDAEIPFILNIQRVGVGSEEYELYIWTNSRMYYKDEFVGVVTTGTPFNPVFDVVFGEFDSTYRRGYIIDQYSSVRIDSAGKLQTHYMGFPIVAAIPELGDNRGLRQGIADHLDLRTNGIFLPGLYTYESIPMDTGVYLYASIAPIMGTNWSVIILSSHLGIFADSYLPVIIAAFAFLVLIMVAGNLMIRRVVLDPLAHLTSSVEVSGDINSTGDLFGNQREDEIGLLSRTIQSMRNDLRDAMERQRRADVAEQSNEAKSRFLARMSHEIRTPITSVLGISEIQLRNPKHPPYTEESFVRIHSAAHMLLKLVNDILDLSSIEAEKMALISEEYDIASNISDVVHQHLSSVHKKGITLQLHIDENLPVTFIGDTLRLAQILNNILSNAIKYTEKGRVDLTASCEGSAKKGEVATLVISIRDTGMGMTKEQLDALHEDYTRFHERENLRIGGTGLGMAIVYSLAEIMNATVDVESKVGEGTLITVRLPQIVATDEVLGEVAARSLERFKVGLGSIKSKFLPEPMPYGKVLVVDDMEANLYVARGLLSFYGLEIDFCENGYEAVEKVRKGYVYDIVFMDHMMPGMNGIDTMLAMRQMGYTAPVVALTANALVGQAEEFMSKGFDGFISKPIQTKQLNDVLNKFVRDKQPPEVLEAAKSTKTNGNRNAMEDYLDATCTKLRVDFAKNHKKASDDIKNALNEGDRPKAHRLSHNLKSLANLIGEGGLAKAAEQIEHLLAAEAEPSEEQLALLDSELARALETIDIPRCSEKAETATDLQMGETRRERVADTLEKLTILLKSRSSSSTQILSELLDIPEAAVLVKQVEEMDFALASKTLETLRKVLEL